MGVVLDGASGLRTLTSKNVFSKWPPQKPSAAMSDLAPMSCSDGRGKFEGFSGNWL